MTVGVAPTIGASVIATESDSVSVLIRISPTGVDIRRCIAIILKRSQRGSATFRSKVVVATEAEGRRVSWS